MKPSALPLVVAGLLALAWSLARPPAPAPSAPNAAPVGTCDGSGPTGALGVLGDVVYGPGEHVIDLALEGAYDAQNWWVLFDYASLTIAAGATVTFANHPSRAPVVIRACGEIVIDGTLALDGEGGAGSWEHPVFAEPGPGGFRGGRGSRQYTATSAAGFGPGGGFKGPDTVPSSGSASHLGEGAIGGGAPPAPTYGSPAGAPLVGGSGGAGGPWPSDARENGGGGAGGGAVLIGSDTRVVLNGAVTAAGGTYGPASQYPNGNGGGGSGGTIRLFAPELDLGGASTLDARGGGGGALAGGVGAIRIEVDGDTQSGGGPNPSSPGGTVTPPASVVTTLGPFLPIDAPTVTLTHFWDAAAMGGAGAWIAIDADPRATFFPPTWADVQLPESGLVTFRIEGRDVPLGAPLFVRTTSTVGAAAIDSAHTMGEVAGSTLATSWTDVEIDLSDGVSAIQARVVLP